MNAWRCIIAASALASPAFAVDVPFRQRPADGGFPGEWLTALAAGAREAGLAGASTALTGGGAAYANPAGISSGGRSGEAVIMVAPLLFSGQYQALSVSYPLSDSGDIGASFLHMGSGSADKTDALGRSIGSFSEEDHAFLLSCSQRAGDIFSAGLSLKAVRQSMAERSASGFGADLGFQLRLLEGLTAGVSALNVARPKLRLEEETDTFPLFLRLGAAYRHAMLDRPVILSADAGTAAPDGGGRRLYRYAAAMEIQPVSSETPFFVRFGVNQREYTAGFGVGSGNFLFDYAASFHEAGVSHRFGLTFRYDVVSKFDVRRIRDERLKALKLEARDWLKAGNLEKSGAAVARILEIEEEDADAAAIMAEIRRQEEKAAAGARAAEAKAAAAAKYASARRSYRAGQYRKALDAMSGLEDMFEGDVKALGLIAMSRAHVLIAEERYAPAMAELRKAVELDPDNREAAILYKRLGDIAGPAENWR
ncbi:MAG TPA: hypothetical protein PL037_01165 [Elusimicrobiales bacterium]|nr:hypothetical protein [Elusimicrobiales bacterium]